MFKKLLTDKNLRWLFQTLVLSLFLNIIFVSLFFYFLVRQNPFPFEFDYTPTLLQKVKPLTNKEQIEELYLLSYEKLFDQLNDDKVLEDGYSKRDLALSILVEKYHFDLKRALKKNALSTKVMECDGRCLPLFPGLKASDFELIKTFAIKEKWPFTAKGLFALTKAKGLEKEPTLALAFLQTPEFQLVESLFKDSKVPIKKKWLLTMILEGDVSYFLQYYQEQTKTFDLSEEKRESFLVNYIKAGSKTAASLLLMTDWDFALRRLDDQTLLCVLDLLPSNSKKASFFAKELLKFPRSDLVLGKARKLAGIEDAKEVAQIRPPRPSIGELRPQFRDRPPSSPSPNQHIIQNGETLFTIARKYHVSMEDLKRINQLPSTSITPGKTLKLPPRN